ncbi:unnamed protein product [Umbelopsis ramanniana]
MKVAFAGLLTLAAAVLAAPYKSQPTLPWDDKSVYEKHTIKANGIEASFMEYGAVITNLWVNDKHGVKRDIILGWDDTTQYNVNAQHPYFGALVGRYANRIKNGTFEINDQKYFTPINEHGVDTLHGGFTGTDRLNWTITDKGNDYIVFESYSHSGDQGFPGNLLTKVKYSVNDKQQWTIDYEGSPDADTPIMMSQHTYWRLDAFTSPDPTIKDHVLQIKGDKFIKCDEYEVPTGEIASVSGTALDFTQPKPIGQDLMKAQECGTNCTGYDNAWVITDPNPSEETLVLYSPYSGIQLAINTDQFAYQFYSCVTMDGTIPVKKTQANGQHKFVEQYGCLVLEAENYIDGVNNPQWGDKYTGIVKGGDKYTQSTTYTFSIHK